MLGMAAVEESNNIAIQELGQIEDVTKDGSNVAR